MHISDCLLIHIKRHKRVFKLDKSDTVFLALLTLLEIRIISRRITKVMLFVAYVSAQTAFLLKYPWAT